MSKKDSQFQKRVMSLMFRGEEKARTVRLAKQDESIWRSASGGRVQ